MGRFYYIDPDGGDDQNDGQSLASPWRTHIGRVFQPGDSVLFKRGSIIRGELTACSGEPGRPVRYGAYGEGDAPVFLGSLPIGTPDDWRETAANVWQYGKELPSEACNLIFNGGETCGNLRWCVEDLKRQGQWHYTRIGLSNDEDGDASAHAGEPGILTLYSQANPGQWYSDMECALYGSRRLACGERHIVLEDLAFRNAGVHGYQEIGAECIEIRRCEFSHIGGAVWSRKRRIRFGNAVELWENAKDVAVKNCVFRNIYDSGVTHQGCDDSGTPRNLRFTGNLFMGCGMAAYECRGPAAADVYFQRNVCVDAGGGFSPQGEPPPRQSEIYPEPMGHHVFIWRIAKGTQTGRVTMSDNIFYEAANGAAIYSQIDPEDEKNFIIDQNVFCQSGEGMLFRMNDCVYRTAEFSLYQQETGHDQHSLLINSDQAVAFGQAYQFTGGEQNDEHAV